MRKKSIHFLTAGFAAALAMVPAASQAQDDPASGNAQAKTPVTPEQQAEINSWSRDQELAYEMWPEVTRNYYWTLPASRQKIFWRLSDKDKVALSTMTTEEQEAVWTRLEKSSATPESSNDARPPMEDGQAG